jgi:hypothetical protein
MTFPPIPLDVLLAISKAFPERSPSVSDTHADLMVRAGEARVVRFLQRMYDERNENILSPEDDAQDVPA